MHKILKIKISKDIDLVLGTAIEITAILNEDKPTSITITIEDPNTTEVVSTADMSRVNTKVYNYIYQSDEDGNEGDYIITIESTKDSYTSVKQKIITLREQD